MGCDIHSVAVDANGKVVSGGKWADGKDVMSNTPYADLYDDDGEPFGNRNYGVFGFLADVRNYSAVTPISTPRGMPNDVAHDDGEEWLGDHSFSWLSISELASFDYDAPMEDRRYTGQHPMGFVSGALTADEGEGAATTYRDFLGASFFQDLAELKRIGADRVVFGFDS